MKRMLELEDTEAVRCLLGVGDRNLRRVREEFGVEVVARDSIVTVQGNPRDVDLSMRAFLAMLREIREGSPLGDSDVSRILRDVREGTRSDRDGGRAGRTSDRTWGGAPGRAAERPHPRRKVEWKSGGQREYMKAMDERDVVFCTGPAGTGKTFLAVARAVEALEEGDVRRMVLVRPAVEAGEHLGFLPGDYREKINPYLQPLYDALREILPPSQVSRYMELGVIEVAPLAYMRGRTLNSSFVILDEAQNTTPKQMLMFLTRLGFDSRSVITGDITQVDLPEGTESGLINAREVLRGVPGVAFVELTDADIVRHPLVQRIVAAYERRGRAGGPAGRGAEKYPAETPAGRPAGRRPDGPADGESRDGPMGKSREGPEEGSAGGSASEETGGGDQGR
ncbi:MAG: PhoH family protein [Planctomycetota bacterium]|nr:PhoH family protein [Planctomycetota bacterium]